MNQELHDPQSPDLVAEHRDVCHAYKLRHELGLNEVGTWRPAWLFIIASIG